MEILKWLLGREESMEKEKPMGEFSLSLCKCPVSVFIVFV